MNFNVYLVFPDEAISILSNFVYVYASLDTFWFVRLIYIYRFGVGIYLSCRLSETCVLNDRK